MDEFELFSPVKKKSELFSHCLNLRMLLPSQRPETVFYQFSRLYFKFILII